MTTATQNILPRRHGNVADLGVVELIQVPLVSGNTTASISFAQVHRQVPFISAIADYASSNIYISSLTNTGVTITFADPSGNKNIYLTVVGG